MDATRPRSATVGATPAALADDYDAHRDDYDAHHDDDDDGGAHLRPAAPLKVLLLFEFELELELGSTRKKMVAASAAAAAELCKATPQQCCRL